MTKDGTVRVRIAEFERKLTGLMTHSMCTNMYSKLVGIGEDQFFNPVNTDSKMLERMPRRLWTIRTGTSGLRTRANGG